MKMRRFSRAACWPMNSASDLGRSAASASSTRRVEEISRSSLMRAPQPNRHAELVSASIVPLVLIQRGQTQPNRQIDPPRIFGRSEEHTSDLQSLLRTSYAVFCLKKKNTTIP